MLFYDTHLCIFAAFFGPILTKNHVLFGHSLHYLSIFMSLSNITPQTVLSGSKANLETSILGEFWLKTMG